MNTSRSYLLLNLIVLVITSSCSGGGGSGGSSNSSGATVISGAVDGGPAPVTPQVAQQQEIAQLQLEMNQEPQYQLSADELGDLAEDGVITEAEQQELTQLLVQ